MGLRVEILDDCEGIYWRDYLITLGIDEKSRDTAIMNHSSEIDSKGVVRVRKKMLLHDRNAKADDHFG